MADQSIRLRFAPSPTGELHIGTLRTALFNWVYTQKVSGTFILRIEDTDLQRSDRKYESGILDGMKWVGLSYDEGPDNAEAAHGPYRQSERIQAGLYAEYAQSLIDSGHAYYCFCTDEDLEKERQAAKAANKPYVYSKKCSRLSKEERQSKLDQKIPYTIRFKMPEKVIKFNDLIRGEIEFDTSLISDFVIIKSDGTPSYNFSVVIDDWKMAVTHVVRGEDHISNTPRQIAVFEALGASLPEFAHLPMILGPDKAKLSKRHGATSIIEYRDQGFLPQAFFNYLMLLGWSPGDNQEILPVEEVIKRFDFSQIGKGGAVFDIKKLTWMNGQYIRKCSPEELNQAVQPFLSEKSKEKLKIYSEENVKAIIYSVRDNLDRLTEINEYIEVYVWEDSDYEGSIKDREWSDQEKEVVQSFSEHITTKNGDLSPISVDEILNDIVSDLELGKGKVFKPIRIACTGFQSGPNLSECLSIFGSERLTSRLNNLKKTW